MERTLYKKTKWLRFYIIDRKPKTVVMEVANTSNQYLGDIYWYGKWRQYVYESEDGILYNHQCLKDIADVCTALNDEHRKQSKK